jgi:hypothetical protein
VWSDPHAATAIAGALHVGMLLALSILPILRDIRCSKSTDWDH